MGRRAGERAGERRRGGEKKRNNLLWLSRTGRLARLRQALCLEKKREKERGGGEKLSSRVCCKCFDVSKIRKLRLMVCLHFLSVVCTVARFVRL